MGLSFALEASIFASVLIYGLDPRWFFSLFGVLVLVLFIAFISYKVDAAEDAEKAIEAESML
jgi:hypothetical protein